MTVAQLWSLFRRNDYLRAREDGLIRVQKHPELDLWIHNYSQAAQFTKDAWNNDAVRMCRGIVTNKDDEVMAQPFPKFFNYGQPEAGTLEMKQPARVMDKIDGSLGILYPTGRRSYSGGLRVPEYRVATRGSFTSDQALHASEIWRTKYEPWWTPNPQWTYLFEIVYPENRIVVDYGDRDELVLLGAHFTGSRPLLFTHPYNTVGTEWWPGTRAKVFPERTLAEALEKPPRDNAEGLVVLLSRKMVKIKQDDYLALHRLITGLRPRSIWEFLAVNACKDLIEKPKHWGSKLGLDPARAQEVLEVGPDWRSHYLESVPDEFIGWVDENVENITRSVEELEASLAEVAVGLKHLERREYFKEIKNHEYFGILGLMYDDRDVTTELWKAVYPSAERAFKEPDEDTS